VSDFEIAYERALRVFRVNENITPDRYIQESVIAITEAHRDGFFAGWIAAQVPREVTA